jgi:hypothetical protein
MFVAGALTFQEFMMHESLPLATIVGAANQSRGQIGEIWQCYFWRFPSSSVIRASWLIVCVPLGPSLPY